MCVGYAYTGTGDSGLGAGGGIGRLLSANVLKSAAAQVEFAYSKTIFLRLGGSLIRKGGYDGAIGNDKG